MAVVARKYGVYFFGSVFLPLLYATQMSELLTCLTLTNVLCFIVFTITCVKFFMVQSIKDIPVITEQELSG